MKKKNNFKKILILFFSIAVIFIGLNIFWDIYQAQNINVVSVDDVSSVSISSDRVLTPETEITGEVKVDSFEEVTHINKEKVNEVLYIIIHKQPSFSSKNTFSTDLNDVNDIESINNITIISGDIYTGEGVERGYSPGNFMKFPHQEIIWEKPVK